MAEVWRFFAHEDDFADLDKAGACERLGRVLSFPTISSMDAEAVDWQPFDDLRAYMQQAWPHVFAAGEAELIDHSLLVTLGGSDPALKPVMLMGHMDVVPVVPGTEADWTHAPFSGHVDDTYIWGRGAIDMKDQVAGILEAVEYALAQGLKHVPFVEQFAHGGAFATGNDQGVDAVNILELTYLAGRRTQTGNSGHMLAKGSLKSQNAYAKLRHYQPRSCMRSAEGMVEISMPTMGSPRSREISASMAKSL